jgi:hypothetical protein
MVLLCYDIQLGSCKTIRYLGQSQIGWRTCNLYLNCLFGITILAAQFPQVYSPKIPVGISRKSFFYQTSQYVPIIFLERCYI